jgi:hypothetical protein
VQYRICYRLKKSSLQLPRQRFDYIGYYWSS